MTNKTRRHFTNRFNEYGHDINTLGISFMVNKHETKKLSLTLLLFLTSSKRRRMLGNRFTVFNEFESEKSTPNDVLLFLTSSKTRRVLDASSELNFNEPRSESSKYHFVENFNEVEIVLPWCLLLFLLSSKKY